MQLRSARARALVDVRRGGRLASLVVDDHELLVTADTSDDPLRWGCYPMVPWAGRVAYGQFGWEGASHRLPITLGPHAIHGTGYVSTWDQTGPGRIDLELSDPWPWAGVVSSDFLLDDTSLRWTLTVTTQEDQGWPVMVGWHPWFRRAIGGKQAELAFIADAQMEQRDDQIPTGRLVSPSPGPWDDCFADVDQPITISWAGLIDLELRSDCSHWVVYTEPEHAICVEPQSDGPDAFNRPQPDVVASSGGPFARTFEIRWA